MDDSSGFSKYYEYINAFS